MRTGLDSTTAEGGLELRVMALAADPSKCSARDIWMCLHVQEKAAAVLAALRNQEEGPVRPWAVDAVSKHRRFRRKSVEQWPDEKLAGAAALLIPRSSEVLNSLLTQFHWTQRSQLLSTFLDEMQLPHEAGQLAEVEHVLEPDRVIGATGVVLSTFPPRDVLVYLLTLRLVSSFLVPGIEEWLPELVNDAQVAAGGGPDSLDDAAPITNRPPDDTDEFTTLDRLLVRAIVDSAQGVEGALDPDEVVDLVEELIELNGHRHRSFFELGFGDVVLGRKARDDLPARNDSRAAWYWSGYVNGLAREARSPEIVDLFDHVEEVRRLGESGQGASSTAAPLIFQALCGGERYGEAAAFLSTDALLENPHLTALVHDEGRRLLWMDRAPQARGFIDLLADLIDQVDQEDLEVPRWFSREVRRRQAHCFRQLGEMPKAKRILDSLLEVESDPGIRSMVLADLGLVAGGFRSLTAVRLPDGEDMVGEVREALVRGEEMFRRGASSETRFRAHGHFCLGVLAMTRGHWPTARQHLELAISGFEGEPDRYQAGGLLNRARLYQGLALALELDKVRAERAAELIETALAAAEPAPKYLRDKVVEALHIGDSDCALEVAEAFLDEDPDFLDLLVGTELMSRSEGLQSMLLGRANDPDRPWEARTSDYRALLPELLNRGARIQAADILDCLEGMAHEGICAAELIRLLEVRANFDPAWSPRDALWARVRLLRMAGRDDEVATTLAEEFYRALHNGRHDGVCDAEQIVDVLAEMRRSDAEVGPLRAALEAMALSAAPPDEHPPEGSLVRVLFVGGDERQEEAARRLKAELRSSYPGLIVRFEHPGWSSNWGSTLERIVANLPGYDAVVIMRYVRTEFGRRLREQLQIPWVPCAGSGQEQMKRSILTAATWGRNHRKARGSAA